MNYHNITKNDMLNGEGLRVVLWVSGCEHHCKGCQNPETWDFESGIPFDDDAKAELFEDCNHDYISGITFSGGDPLAIYNRDDVFEIMKEFKEKFPDKNIWCYTGYTIDELFKTGIDPEKLKMVDVLVDGPYVEELRDVSLNWVGSSNQKVIHI